MLVDSHCHLDFPEFAAERAAVIARAKAAGVRAMLTIGTKMGEFPQVRAIAESDPDVWCSVGIHPHEADKEPAADIDRLVAECAHPKVIGIGETGLDYFYEHCPRAAQQRNFRDHIRAGQQTGLPVIIHTRDADDDTATILDEAGPFAGVVHCFTSSTALARKALDHGLYISISGIVTFKTAADLRETLKMIPLDRLLIETDAPFLAPIPKRGKRNEPAFVAHTAAFVAAEKGVPAQQLAAVTTDNFFRLFAKARRPS